MATTLNEDQVPSAGLAISDDPPVRHSEARQLRAGLPASGVAQKDNVGQVRGRRMDGTIRADVLERGPAQVADFSLAPSQAGDDSRAMRIDRTDKLAVAFGDPVAPPKEGCGPEPSVGV